MNQSVLTPAAAPQAWPASSAAASERDCAGRLDRRMRRGNRGLTALKVVGRLALWSAVAVLVVAGLEQVTAGSGSDGSTSGSGSGQGWPTGVAEQAAARFVVDYLTWNEDSPQTRAAALSMDLPPGVDFADDWDGRGRQRVVLTIAAGVRRQDSSHGVVPVHARVVPSVRTGRAAVAWRDLAEQWRVLAVPVELVGGRVVVSGSPTYVSLPLLPRVQSEPAADDDPELTGQTRPDIEKFFAAYSAGDPGAYTAPGVRLAGLDGAVSFVDLDSWSVHRGGDDSRDAVARVRWRDVTGAGLRQVYRLRLVRVATATGSRWFVGAVDADTHGGR